MKIKKHEIFIEIYQETLNIFNELSEKIFILTNLAVNENWSNGRLIVTDERLVDLEAEADALSSKNLSMREQMVTKSSI
nr:hypothetical protein [Pseudomonas sp. BIGb0427]